MILVTGAAGKTGKAVIQSLLAAGRVVRAFVFKEEYRSALQQLGAQEVVVGDLLQPGAVQAALHGAQAVYHICPNFHPEEAAIGKMVIRAAEESGCSRMVYHSVLHPQTSAMPHHWSKLHVEAALFESKLDYTILQPCAYMQNVLKDLREMIADKTCRLPYSAQAKFSLVDLNDVAEAARVVLTTSGHTGATYELCGPEVLSMSEVVAMISKESGMEISLLSFSPRDWMKQAAARRLPAYQREGLGKMFEYYDQFGFWGNSRVLQWILGRRPNSMRRLIAWELAQK